MIAADLWEMERALRAGGFSAICGADEAGAGPLAGPVYAAAVLLPFGLELVGLNDSKKLTEKTKNRLFDEIQEKAFAWAVEAVDVATIEKINILNARLLAMDRAILALNPAADFAIIDGNRDAGIHLTHCTAVHGDARSANVAAASVLAKVSRDRYMIEADKRYPQYAFARHKGYGTAQHFALLREFGPCPLHRPSFLKNL